jgi:hypothetical protein
VLAIAFPARGRPGAWGVAQRPRRVGYCHLPHTEEAAEDMAWTWQFETADGTLVPSRGVPRETFASQGDAESWLGENWRDLLAGGVDQVSLLEENRVEYGPMSLHAE